jgi:ADYC domain
MNHLKRPPGLLARAVVCTSLLAPLAACAVSDEPLALGETDQAICGFGCGDNGVVIDGIHFWELNLAQQINDQKFRFLRFALTEEQLGNGVLASLDIVGDRLIAMDSSGNTYSGEQLREGVLELVRTEGQTEKHYLVKIMAVQDTPQQGQPFWTHNPTNAFVETYTFGWNTLPEDPDYSIRYRPMCETATAPGENWNNLVAALVFEGERYDVHTKNIYYSPITPGQAWFNIACAGSVPAKMHLARRTSAASGGAFSSTIQNDRQAFLRMWTADYCGDGSTHTVAGQKIRVRDKKPFALPNNPLPNTEGWIPHQGPVGFAPADVKSYEAIWNSTGAVCLDTPRHGENTREEIAAECLASEDKVLPTCAAYLTTPESWKSYGQLLTANPIL